MPEIKLKNIQIAFPALAEPQAFGDGEPAYGGKFPVKPGSDHQKLIDAAMLEAATDKWKADGKSVLELLIEKDKVCFVKKEYKNKKGEPYDGFKGTHYLSTRNAKAQPTIVDRFGKEVLGPNVGYGPQQRRDAERLIHSGAITHISIDIWAQDNQWGRRINATLRGVMWAGEGENFGGGATPASADEFADMAEVADDLV